MPNCPKCGNKCKTFDLRKEWGIEETQLYCDKCGLVHYNVSRPIEVYIGRITKGLGRDRTFRLIVEEPTEQTGQQILARLVPYTYLVKLKRGYSVKTGYKKLTASAGDRVVLGGLMVKGVLEAYYSKNITLGIEEDLLPKVTAKLGIFKKISVDHPYSFVAKQEISQMEVDKAKISAPIDYHVQARPFELLVSQLFEKLGFKNIFTSGGASDKGIDIVAYTTNESGSLKKVIVQCKHQSLANPVKPTQVRDFAYTIERESAYRGYFVTSSLFSSECFFKENCGDKMTLIDRNELQRLLKQHRLSLDTVEKV